MNVVSVIILEILVFYQSNVVTGVHANFNKLSDDSNTKNQQLRLVSVIFRHGDRTPDSNEMFPNDPNCNNTFFPVGHGRLTNAGKLREYRLGKKLRQKYDNFLGEFYIPNSVFAQSTDYDRTKTSLQLVLAALYPPRNEQLWNQHLPWQPIPATYIPWQIDGLMLPEECTDFVLELDNAVRLPEVQSKIKSIESFLKNLTELTGKNISTPFDTYYLYHLFAAESSMNLTLPKWSEDIFPRGKLFDAIQLNYEIYGYTKKMLKMNGGRLLHRLIKDMEKIKNGTMEKYRRINLYSGHESNIVASLQALGLFEPHVPEYSSALIFEFIELNSGYYVKVLYYKSIPEVTEALIIPGCELLCPFDQFVDLLKDVTSATEELTCHKET